MPGLPSVATGSQETLPLDAWQWSAAEASARMAQGALSSEAYVRACLDRIAQREGDVRAWAHLDADAAIAQARARDREPRRSVLHGIPVGLKDVIRTRDLPTTFNSPVYEGGLSAAGGNAASPLAFPPAEDAHCVAVLRALGAVILGKTQTLEFACGGRFPPTRNPWDQARTPGGSSSGSGAAVADGMVPLALGTQTGGSTIRPAAFCGVFGMKPTWGRLPFDGIKSFAAHLDTVGLYGRSVDDLLLLWQAWGLSEPDEDARAVGPARALRLGVCRTPYWDQAEPAAQQAFEGALSRLSAAGVTLVPCELGPEHAAINTWQDEIMQDGGRSAFRPEMLAAPALLHEEFQRKLGNHLGLTPARLRAALDAVARCRMDFERALDGLDGALTLSAPGVAPVGLHTQGLAVFNRLWTALQVPCVSLPVLWSPEGLPLGLQLVGPRYEDGRLLEVAARVATLFDPPRHPWN
jgi:Asp-tRNA(Asn)/Glu-tRNA(Gln) amidotransferase A subunit family amidase